MGQKVLLTSVCRPLGEKYGDAPSVGYELLFGQVTRAQGLFSPRATHIHFSLEYVAENLNVPTTVLQYPSRRELIRELKKGYSYVGISFVLATFHRMKEVVELVRRYSPDTKIILGGYGTVLGDGVLNPFADYICREEGVSFMRRLLGEPDLPLPYKHPQIISHLRIFGKEVSRTGMIFAGLGCPNGCDFCCTSHFFKRRHIKLLPTGSDIYNVVRSYHENNPRMPLVILDEDFLLNKNRALEFRDYVKQHNETLSIFAFASVRALSQYNIEEILEMGLDGFWIGYEGTRSGFAKQSGRSVEELFCELREHGVSILASMIVGLPYQTPLIIKEELEGLMSLRPDFCQFLIYGPTPGTPFYERIIKEGLLHADLAENPEAYYKKCSGFFAMVEHPTMTATEIEIGQQECYQRDFNLLGPSIYRTLSTWFMGYQRLKTSLNPLLYNKANYFKSEIRKAYPIFLAGRLLGPNQGIRKWVRQLESQIHHVLGKPSFIEKMQSIAIVGLALYSGLKLKLGWFQHPRLIRHVFRMPKPSPIHIRLKNHFSTIF